MFEEIPPAGDQRDWSTWSQDLAARPLTESLQWVWQELGPQVALASSFGAEDMVLIDQWCHVCSDPQIFYLDTGLLFPETVQLITTAERRYGFRAIRVTPDLSLDLQAQTYGPALWQHDPDRCCQLRKVHSLQRFLQDHTAWITGIRRDQTPARRQAPWIAWDPAFGLVKVNPLIHWTAGEVFGYLLDHQVPYNPLHDQGYPSIGCLPCTHTVQVGEDPRAGRWRGKEKTECGLHLPH